MIPEVFARWLWHLNVILSVLTDVRILHFAWEETHYHWQHILPLFRDADGWRNDFVSTQEHDFHLCSVPLGKCNAEIREKSHYSLECSGRTEQNWTIFALLCGVTWYGTARHTGPQTGQKRVFPNTNNAAFFRSASSMSQLRINPKFPKAFWQQSGCSIVNRAKSRHSTVNSSLKHVFQVILAMSAYVWQHLAGSGH